MKPLRSKLRGSEWKMETDSEEVINSMQMWLDEAALEKGETEQNNVGRDGDGDRRPLAVDVFSKLGKPSEPRPCSLCSPEIDQAGLIITGLGRLLSLWSDLLKTSPSVRDAGKRDCWMGKQQSLGFSQLWECSNSRTFYGRMSMGFEVSIPDLPHLLVVWLWASYWMSLSSNFYVYKKGE